MQLLHGPAAVAAATATEEVLTDGTGNFEIPRLRPGTYRLEARKEDSVSPTVEVELTVLSPPVTLMVMPGATLRVTVLAAADRRPIANATVKVAPGNMELGPIDGARTAQTDGAGVARFVGLTPTGNHGVYAEAPGYAGLSVNLLAGAFSRRQEWKAEVLLKPGIRISGRVTNPAAQPVAGAQVGWLAGDPDPEGLVTLLPPFQGISKLGTPVTDKDGRYSLSVPLGKGNVRAVHPSYQPAEVRELVAQAGRNLDGIDLTLRDGGRIAGVVLNAQGVPVAGAEVLVTVRGFTHQQMFMDAYRFRATSDREGEFAFRGRSQARWRWWPTTRMGPASSSTST